MCLEYRWHIVRDLFFRGPMDAQRFQFFSYESNHILETVDTDTQNLSDKSFSNNPSLSLIKTSVNSCHKVSFRLHTGFCLFGL